MSVTELWLWPGLQPSRTRPSNCGGSLRLATSCRAQPTNASADGRTECLDPFALAIAARLEQRDLAELALTHVLDEARDPGLAGFELARELYDQHLGSLSQCLAAGLLEIVVTRQACGRVDW